MAGWLFSPHHPPFPQGHCTESLGLYFDSSGTSGSVPSWSPFFIHALPCAQPCSRSLNGCLSGECLYVSSNSTSLVSSFLTCQLELAILSSTCAQRAPFSSSLHPFHCLSLLEIVLPIYFLPVSDLPLHERSVRARNPVVTATIPGTWYPCQEHLLNE